MKGALERRAARCGMRAAPGGTMTGVGLRGRLRRRAPLAFAAPAAAFLVAAASAALVRSQESFDHGWWSVAFLALVGGLSQLLLGLGQLELAGPLLHRHVGRRTLAAELALWNIGVLAVPAGVFAGVGGIVAAGSVLLLAALAFFAATAARAGRASRRRPAALRAYQALLVFLAASVLVGTGLAEALPWQ